MKRREFLLSIPLGLVALSGYANQHFDLEQTMSEIEEILLKYIFHSNDPMTRRDISVDINKLLKSKQGLNASSVVCNAQNNTPQIVDKGQLEVGVFLSYDNTITHLTYAVNNKGVKLFWKVNTTY